MSNLIKDAKEQLHDIIIKALDKMDAKAGPSKDFNIEIPADISHGDLSTNVAMVNAKVLRNAPIKIANEIVK